MSSSNVNLMCPLGHVMSGAPLGRDAKQVRLLCADCGMMRPFRLSKGSDQLEQKPAAEAFAVQSTLKNKKGGTPAAAEGGRPQTEGGVE